MPLSDHVTITITRDTVGVARAGFGVPLILSHNASWADRVRYYNDLPSLVTDGFDTDSPEYLAAEAMLSQSPRPRRVAIGRAVAKPTQRYEIGAGAAGARSSHRYTVKVTGQDIVGEIEATYTSDATATLGEIALGITAALNGVAGNGYTAAATGGVFPIVVTGDTPGYWFSLEVAVDDLTIAQTHDDPGVAAELTAIQLAQPDWYALHTLYNSEAYVLAAAAWVEANKKIYVFDVNETAAITTVLGNGDTGDEARTDGYTRTLGNYHPSPAAMMSAALLGKNLPYDPGSESWKWKNLAGVSTVTLSATHRANLRARNMNTYESVAGRGMTWEGRTFDGEFLDTVRGLDWVEDDMVKGIFEVLAANPKVPFTDAGITLIESPMRATLRRAVRMGIFAPGTPGDASDPEPTVSVPRAADISASDRALRTLPDMKFSGRLAGAIHNVDVSGTVSI